MLTYGPEFAHVCLDASVDMVTAPVEMLREIHIVDTPGTNAIFREHEAITTDFVPRADFVLFVTSADRPFTETERAFMEAIREWGKKIVIVINKADILETPEDLASAWSSSCARAPPRCSAPSRRSSRSRRAPRLRAKIGGGVRPRPPRRSHALEQYLATTLDQQRAAAAEAAQSPWGRLAHCRARAGRAGRASWSLLDDDLQAIDDIERQQATYRDDMSREFRHRLSSVDNVLHAFEAAWRRLLRRHAACRASARSAQQEPAEGASSRAT